MSSKDQHRGPSDWPLCQAFFQGSKGGGIDASLCGCHPSLSSCLLWVQKGQKGKGKGDRRWAGDLAWGRHAICSPETQLYAHGLPPAQDTYPGVLKTLSWRGKKKWGNHPKADKQLLFTKHKRRNLPRPCAGSLLGFKLNSKLRTLSPRGFPAVTSGPVLGQVQR